MYQSLDIAKLRQKKSRFIPTKDALADVAPIDWDAIRKDYNLSPFIEKHQFLIKSVAVKNPTISKDDEWIDEDVWDEYIKDE